MFIPTNEAVLWCNQAIKNEVTNIVTYSHALEIGLIALILGALLVEIGRYKMKKYYIAEIEKLNSELRFLKAEMGVNKNNDEEVIS